MTLASIPQEIHRKVMSQNFTNCHTKIRHVDAHATLNDGVVVQVMGLLSNNNQALRRFMQTFVLAPEVCCSVVMEYLKTKSCVESRFLAAQGYRYGCRVELLCPLVLKLWCPHCNLQEDDCWEEPPLNC